LSDAVIFPTKIYFSSEEIKRKGVFYLSETIYRHKPLAQIAINEADLRLLYSACRLDRHAGKP